MSALALACQRRPTIPALIVALLAVAGVGCLVVAAVQVAAAFGPALLTAGVIGVAGWLVKTVVAVLPLPMLAGLVVVVVVSPWLLLLAALTVLALRTALRTRGPR